MPLPQTMNYINANGAGGPDVLALASGPVPTPRPDEVLIRVQPAGVNRPDVAQRQGSYPPPPGASPILGLEVAGEVVAAGNQVTALAVGDRVCALTNGGGYAEYCTAPASQCLPWPTGYNAIQAGALPETSFTVWANLFQMGRLAKNETALVHGGASGIGVTAIQLAHEFGARIFVTAGTDDKCAACLRLGADAAINYRTQRFRRGGQNADRGPRRRRRPGYGRRSLHDAQRPQPGHGWAAGHDRLPGGIEGPGIRLRAGDGAPADNHRIDHAAPHHRAESGHRGRPAASLARARCRTMRPGDPRNLPVGAGSRGAPTDGIQPAYRQDHAVRRVAASRRQA